jgi:transposase
VATTRDQKGGSESTTPEQNEQVVRLQKEVEQLKLLLGRATSRIQRLETDLDNARSQVAWFHRQLFGQKADRVRVEDLETAWHAFLKAQETKARGVPDLDATRPEDLSSIQLLLGFVGASALDQPSSVVEPAPDSDATSVSAADGAQTPAAPPKKKGHGRNRVPPTLRDETIVIQPDNIPEGARQVGTEITHRVGIRRAEMVRFTIVRPKYAQDGEDDDSTQITIAEPPHEMIPRGVLTPSGLAHVIASKWDRHVPYNRLARFFEGSGYRLPVSTLSGVAIRAAPLAKMLVDAMTAYAQKVAPYLAIDATGVLLQRPEACLRGHVWVRYIEDVCVLVSFTKSHDSEAAGAQLDGWSCPTLGDGTQVYDKKQRETQNARGGCWSHGRRRLVYSAPTDARALVGIKWINEIFAVERSVLEATPERRLAERMRRSAPIVDRLFAWRDELLGRGNLGRSLLAKALRYQRNQEERLKYFLTDGRIPIHNNAAELQIRHLAVGRRNWLFFGSERGAEAGSIWLSLVLSARLHDLDVEEYLRDLFRILPAWPNHRLLELAPHRWRATRARLDPLELYREIGSVTVPPRLDS